MNHKEIIMELERRRDELCDELQIIGYSILNDKNMPIAVKELRVIRANALEHEIGLLTNRIIELSDSEKTIRVEYIGEDDWSRELYKNVDNGKVYALVDNWYYTLTSDGEPSCPLRKDAYVTIVKSKRS